MNDEIYKRLSRVPDDYTRYHIRRTLELMDNKQRLYTYNIIKRFTSIIPGDFSDIQKATLLYEAVTRRVRYSKKEKCELKYCFPSALIAKESVCMGIAELYSILCNWIGIGCRIIIGCSSNGNEADSGGLHAWNLVKLPIDCEYLWFHCDPTWDLKEYTYSSNRFFLKSDIYMIDNGHIWLSEKYPKCPVNYKDSISIDAEGGELICRILDKVIACT